MAVSPDDSPKFQQYAHPDRLVSTDWLAARIEDGSAGGPAAIVIVESDEDVLLYDTGHVPGSVKVDWHNDLNDPLARDYVDGSASPRCWAQRGIGRDTTVVFYGDKSNWWAAYALWVFTLFGHEDVRLLDGGRAKWVAEGRELTREVPVPEPADYPVVERDDTQIRAFKDDVLAHLGQPLVDVRSPGEYSGELLHMPDYPQEGAMRGGHIPGREVGAVGARGRRGRHVQVASRPRGHLPRRAGPAPRRRRGRLLPDRRALVAHLVRADPPARLRPACATTTGRGPSGATPCGSRSRVTPT